MTSTDHKKRLLTGDRPTGKLHLGHYVGTLQNRVRLQDQFECFFIIADLHMLTTKNSRADIQTSGRHARDLVLDALSAGINPEEATFYLQSPVSEVYEINTLFQNLVTVPRLKDMARDAKKEEMPYGLLGYPVLQSADVLCVKAEMVPVGKDNMAHIEVTREIARRFNNLYGPVFPLPESLVGEVPTLVGTDGKSKMSKSLNNAIFLDDDAETVARKVAGMFTDPARVRADVPGSTENNPVFIYHDIFNADKDEVANLKEMYQRGAIGDVEVKRLLTKALNAFLEPMRERRSRYTAKPGFVEDVILRGTEKTRSAAKEVLKEVRTAMGFTAVWRNIRGKAGKMQQ
jgi:tryptophanyl-tRNA synthetase